MKKTLLFGVLLGCCSLFSTTKANPVEIICYDKAESKAPNFWVNHFYYAKCTDYLGTGSKSFQSTDYVDFNGGSSVDFTDIYVPKDAVYTVQLSYGIGYAGESGALMTVNVNGELATQLTLYKLAGNPPAIEEFDVELFENYSNVIQFKQSRDWPTLLGIKLVPKGGSSLGKTSENPYYVVTANNMIKIQGLVGVSNQVEIYSIDGKLIYSGSAGGSSLDIPAVKGLYVVKVNGEATKVLVK